MSQKLVGMTMPLSLAFVAFCPAVQASDFTPYNDIRSPIVGFALSARMVPGAPTGCPAPYLRASKRGMTFGDSAVNAACVRTYRIVTFGDCAGSADRIHDICKYLGLHLTANGPTHTPN